jgi:hypothetical protein
MPAMVEAAIVFIAGRTEDRRPVLGANPDGRATEGPTGSTTCWWPHGSRLQPPRPRSPATPGARLAPGHPLAGGPDRPRRRAVLGRRVRGRRCRPDGPRPAGRRHWVRRLRSSSRLAAGTSWRSHGLTGGSVWRSCSQPGSRRRDSSSRRPMTTLVASGRRGEPRRRGHRPEASPVDLPAGPAIEGLVEGQAEVHDRRRGPRLPERTPFPGATGGKPRSWPSRIAIPGRRGPPPSSRQFADAAVWSCALLVPFLSGNRGTAPTRPDVTD